VRTAGSWRSIAKSFALSLLACLLVSKSASAEVTLIEKDGWTFFADGRINAFFSVASGDGFPEPLPAPQIADPASGGMMDARPAYSIYGADAGWTVKAPTFEGTNGKLFTTRTRSGFLGNVFGFGLKRKITETTTAKGYIAIWGMIDAIARQKAATYNTDVRQGYVSFEGPWGSILAGRDLGLYGRIGTEIDFLYGHNYGLGLPCMDAGGNPTCGHVGTGVMGAGFGAGFAYGTPSFAGLKLQVGLYDPVRILGGWDRAGILRPEAQLSWETKFGKDGFVKLAAEGIWQQLKLGSNIIAEKPVAIPAYESSIWGVAGGGRVEYGPVRFGASAFHGRGLGFFTALQNDPSMFNLVTRELRTFTGFYGQGALVFGRVQLSLGAGTAIADQLASDATICNENVCEPAKFSAAKSQTGISAGIFYHLSDNVTLALDYFRFTMDWYGARNSQYRLNPDGTKAVYPSGAEIIDLLPGVIKADTLSMNYLNAGATFHW
jgi:hypothetical protein